MYKWKVGSTFNADDKYPDALQTCDVRTEDDKMVCTIYVTKEEDSESWINKRHLEKISTLIASAPEMCQVLDYVFDALGDDFETLTNPNSSLRDDALNLMRDVLAKAKGDE